MDRSSSEQFSIFDCSSPKLSFKFGMIEEDLNESLLHLLQAQESYSPIKNYIETIQQDGMIPWWRSRICIWMLEAAEEFEMCSDTVACAVNYLDRYLSVYSVDKIVLQIIAMVCIYIASKIYEPQPITMKELELLSRGNITKQAIKNMEIRILKVTQWKLNPPTPHIIARHLIALARQNLDDFIEEEEDDLIADVHRILDSCLKEYTFVKYTMLTVALSAISIAKFSRREKMDERIFMVLSSLSWPIERYESCQSEMYYMQASTICNDFQVKTSIHHLTEKTTSERSPSPTSLEEFHHAIYVMNNDETINCPHPSAISCSNVITSHNPNKRFRRSMG